MIDQPRFFQNLDLATVTDVILDCDDTLYPTNMAQYPRQVDMPLHQRIKHNIVRVVNDHPEMLTAIGYKEKLDLSQLKEPNLPAEIYIGLIRHYQAQGPEALNGLLSQFYGVEYNFHPDQKLADGLRTLHDDGVRLGIDTNGVNFNVIRVLERHNIDADIFDGRMFDIVMAEHGKKTPGRAAEVINFFNIKTPETTLYVDDDPKVLKSMKEAGFKTIWLNDNNKKLDDAMRPYIDAMYPSVAQLGEDMMSARLAMKPSQPEYRQEYRI